MAKWLWEMSAQGSSTRSVNEVNKSVNFYFKLNTLAITVFDIKFQKYKSLYFIKLRKKMIIYLFKTLKWIYLSVLNEWLNFFNICLVFICIYCW